MKKMLFLSVFLACSLLSSAYEGYVFIDKNRNGIYDEGEKVLSDILVSDGLHVVKTDQNGYYSLPGHPKERFLFVTTPSGYMAYNHQYYTKIKDNHSRYDFGLVTHHYEKKDGNHNFIHISDTEIFNTSDHEDWIKNLRDYAKNQKSAFIFHTGDICYEKGLQEHIRLMNTENMQCPVFYSIGNHDLVKGEYGEKLFEDIYGPVYYSFEVGNVHYVVTPMLSGDFAPSYKKEDVYRWLKNDLAMLPPNKAVIVFSHDLLTYNDNFMYKINDSESINLNDYNLKAWLYGHWHIHHMKKQGNVYSICTSSLDKGGIDHSTTAFRVMHVDKKGGVESELRYTYLDKHLQIITPQKGNVVVNKDGNIPFLVNSYSSASPVNQMVYSCQVNGKSVTKNKKLDRQTDWTWGGLISLPEKLKGKEIEIRLTASFDNGEEIETTTSFNYSDKLINTQLQKDWTNLLGNAQHTAQTESKLNSSLSLAWIKNVGANIYMSSPLIYRGNIFVATTDENLKGNAFVCKLSGNTGDILWKYHLRNSVKNSIAIENEYVFVQDVEGWLYAIHATDGKLVWETKLPVNGLPALIDGIVADNGIVYAGSGRGLTAFHASSGEQVWQNTEWNQGEGTTSTLAVSENLIIGTAQWRGLYANDKRTGKLLWKLDKNGIHNRGASPSIHGNTLYLISDKSLFMVDLNKGIVLMRKEFSFNLDVTSTPLLTDKEIIFGSVNEGLIAVDKETWDIKWKFKPDDALIYTAPYTRKPAATIETSPICAGETIFFGASDGNIYGINKEEGTMVWKYSTGAPVFSTVAVSGNTLIATDFGGNVYAFSSTRTEE